MDTVHTIGRRKTSVARYFCSEGKGAITVNKKNYTDYFPNTNSYNTKSNNLYINQYRREL